MSTTEEASDLGAEVERFDQPAGRLAKLLGGALALFVATAVASSMIGDEGTSRDYPIVVTGLLALGGLYLLWFASRVPGRSAIVHEHGLVLRQGGQTYRVRWDRVTAFVANLREAQVGLTGAIAHRYTLVLDDGSKVRIDNSYPRIEALAQVIGEQTARRLADSAVAAVQRGETVSFGPAAISADTVTVGRRSAPIGEVAEVRVSEGRVYLIWNKGGSFKAGAGVPVKSVSNLSLFLSLFDWVRQGGGTPPATAPDHFGSIGVAIDGQASALYQRADAAMTTSFQGGSTVTWWDVSGAAVWFVAEEQGDGDLALVCTIPSLLGGVSWPVRVLGFSEDPGCRYCVAAIVAALDEQGEEATQLAFQLGTQGKVLHPTPTSGDRAQAEVTAFVERCERFVSEEDYLAAQTGEHPYAVRSMIPVGLFAEPTTSHAMLNGVVTAVDHRTNATTAQPFTVVELDGYPSVWQLTMRPEDVPPGLAVGHVLRADCWLAGRLLPAATGGSSVASTPEQPGPPPHAPQG